MMEKFTNPLENIKIASPCSQDWDAMVGDTRKRFCGECKLNVYNLSGMSKVEAEQLIVNAEGRVCVRFYKRSDGTVLTVDCPVGFAAFKRRVSKSAAAFGSLIFGVIGGLGISAFFSNAEKESHTMGTVAYNPTPKTTPKQTPKRTPTPEDMPTMGVMAPIETPSPTPTPKKKDLKAAIEKVVNTPENQS